MNFQEPVLSADSTASTSNVCIAAMFKQFKVKLTDLRWFNDAVSTVNVIQK
jgi:hypothetical protein